MDTPELANAVSTLEAEPAHVLAKVESYEMPLFAFLAQHKFLAAQFAFITMLPTAILAFLMGKHFH